ncbi:Hypothetical protein NTJ_12801 [Nesidiocoris tenuis]|uniref:Uncharacterized protein n=1 Tax=Nesidiocoris tenuis TaxID=355587 RepID=A0ABN7B6H3_9HEMI|nr:Hypothetical protein NTJ_12801 [Nesidiocoris tenuis]
MLPGASRSGAREPELIRFGTPKRAAAHTGHCSPQHCRRLRRRGGGSGARFRRPCRLPDTRRRRGQPRAGRGVSPTTQAHSERRGVRPFPSEHESPKFAIDPKKKK